MNYFKGVMKEGWLSDPCSNWTFRFHRDKKAWIRDPRVFVDKGRNMPDGSAPLLKTRRYLRRDEAERLWKELVNRGCHATEPLWGEHAEP